MRVRAQDLPPGTVRVEMLVMFAADLGGFEIPAEVTLPHNERLEELGKGPHAVMAMAGRVAKGAVDAAISQAGTRLLEIGWAKDLLRRHFDRQLAWVQGPEDARLALRETYVDGVLANPVELRRVYAQYGREPPQFLLSGYGGL